MNGPRVKSWFYNNLQIKNDKNIKVVKLKQKNNDKYINLLIIQQIYVPGLLWK